METQLINLLENKLCTGCGACYCVCPVNAIEMIHDDKGFYKPQINNEKCIKCGKCLKICPLNNFVSNNNQPKVYAFINKDEETRMKSASGSAFPVFAKSIIKNNGVVFGVAWDENIIACHTYATTNQELERMYGSKYVQASTKNTFKEVKEFLDKGKFVLYSGTPCQIAGLKSYLQKDYENLITIDLICHGTPSPLVLEKYKKEFISKNKIKGKILDINFRSKKYGWTYGYNTTTTTTTGIFHKDWLDGDEHCISFGYNLSINDSCLNCQFNKVPRMADITIGDFWGVDCFDRNLNDKKGTSIILLNSEKGKKLFETLKDNCIYKEVPLEFVIKYNPNLISSSIPHKNRDEFFSLFKENNLTLEEINKKFIKRYPKFLIILFRLQPKFLKKLIKKVLGI